MRHSLMSRVRRYAAGGAAILLLAGASACGGDADRERSGQEEGKGALGSLRGDGNRNSERDADRNEERRTERGTSERGSDNGSGTARIGPSDERAGADNFDRRVRIVNNSDQTINLVRGSPTSDDNWGADRIPTMTLAAGDATIVDFNDNNGECRYDLQASFADGTTREQRDVNVCQVREWIVTSSGSSAR